MVEPQAKTSKLARWLKLLTTEFILVLLLLGGALFALYFAIDVAFSKRRQFDNDVFVFLSDFVTPARTQFMLFVTQLGNHKFLLPANLLLLAYFLTKKNRWFSIRVLAVALSSLVLNFSLKYFIHRSRPDEPLVSKAAGFSFPSGHALMSVAFYGLLVFIVWHEVKNKWLKYALVALFVGLIVMISFSRIYLRVHYVSDVFAGLAIGVLWLIFSFRLIQRIQAKYIERKKLEAAASTGQVMV
jgi:membrane-associated phospholipid phosphatase